MAIKTITSLANPRVKDAIRLRDQRHRTKHGRFLIDGAREFLLALDGGIRTVDLFVCVELCKTAESRGVLDRLAEVEADIWHVTRDVLQKIAFGKREDGVLAVAQTPRAALSDLKVPGQTLIAVVEGLEKPGNVGAVLRSADAAGVGAVVVAEGRTDLYNPNCVRASMGTIFTKPVCEAASAETLAWLRSRPGKIFAARVDAKRAYAEVDLRDAAAIVLGSESTGLSETWHGGGVTAIKLPMRGAADSLNISAAAAVLFYEALRQREATR